MSRETEEEKAFMETQMRMIEAQRRVNIIGAQIEAKQREIKRCEITTQELAHLSDSTKTYKGVGKMFLLLPIEDLKIEMRNKAKHGENDISELKKSKISVERVLKESEDNIRELVKQQQQQQRRA